ncbi:MAG TPA: serine/threonine-protein kinase, partial [Clostridia bacterium]|nr:serine/threonine-protein kinase [Clostridia bacterium]
MSAVELVGLVLHGRYKIYEQAGTSGMATVCLAKQADTPDAVTALILEPPITRDAGIVRRFLRSGEMGCHAAHPYVAPVEDYGQEQDLCFMVTRHEQLGVTLADLERRNGPLSMVQSAWVCSCIASALEGALAYGGIPFHGALRPTSVIITPSGDAQVACFGTAPASGAPDQALGGSGALYAAPEQTEGRSVDSRTDLYALGVMLCEMLAQRIPTVSEVRSFLAFEGTTRMEEFLRGIPDKLRPVLSGLLQWDPDERFSSPGEVIEALTGAGFPSPQRPQMESTGPGWERGPDLSSVSAPEPLLLQVPIVGMGDLYARETTGAVPLAADAERAGEAAGSAEIPRPEEGFAWEIAAQPSSDPVAARAVASAPRRRWV